MRAAVEQTQLDESSISRPAGAQGGSDRQSRALQAPRGPGEAVDGAQRRAVTPASLSRGAGQGQRAPLTSTHSPDPGTASPEPRARQAQGCQAGALSPPCHFVSLFFRRNSAVGRENEQAANERAAAAPCQACETPLGAQLGAVGGWTPFIFTLELFSSHPVCFVLFISEAVQPLSDGHRCRMNKPSQ